MKKWLIRWEVDVEQAVEIVPDIQIAQNEFWQWEIGLFAGSKTNNDEKYGLLTARWQPGKIPIYSQA